jgi:two-component system, LytTR family, sensor kinase
VIPMVETDRLPAAPVTLQVRAGEETRYWLLVGLVGWAAVGVITLADMGLQQYLIEGYFTLSWSLAAAVFAWLLPGVLLSAAAVALFRRVPRAPGRWQPPVAVYVLVGLGFWWGWSAAHAGLLRTWPGMPGNARGTYPELLLTLAAGNAFTAIVLYGVAVVLFEATLHRREARDREMRAALLKSQLARARSAELAARLDPHFLFNTLHVASGLMSRAPVVAREVLDDLCELIGESIRSQQRDLVPLRSELHLVERYLRIQEIRFGDRLRTRIRIDPAALACRVPPLLLQPLVENAIHHGISRSRSGGEVRVDGYTSGGTVVLEVINSGSEQTSPWEPLQERVGLGGVRARLDLLFGAQARLVAGHLPNDGFRAVVELPSVLGGDAAEAHDPTGGSRRERGMSDRA